MIRKKFKNFLILYCGYNKERAGVELVGALCDLIGMGRIFTDIPDLVERLENS